MADFVDGPAGGFRIKQAQEGLGRLRVEADSCRSRSQKLRKICQILTAADATIVGLSTILASIIVVCEARKVSGPAALIMECACVALGIMGGGVKITYSRTKKPAEKYEKVALAAISSARSVEALISRGLEDGELSNLQFCNILKELEAYDNRKSSICDRLQIVPL